MNLALPAIGPKAGAAPDAARGDHIRALYVQTPAILAGNLTIHSTIAALIYRETSGKGQFIDISEVEVQLNRIDCVLDRMVAGDIELLPAEDLLP